jgi:hypothetical protein
MAIPSSAVIFFWMSESPQPSFPLFDALFLRFRQFHSWSPCVRQIITDAHHGVKDGTQRPKSDCVQMGNEVLE